MNSDFTERPLIAGSFTGIRSWRVNLTGLLTGVHAQEPWGMGENGARCRPTSPMFQSFSAALARMSVTTAESGWQMAALTASMNGQVYLRKRPKLKPRPGPIRVGGAEHPAGTLDCTCGFYAYFDLGHNPHHGEGNVLGLVEGYGTMTIGRRGFRASKARIIALIEPVPPSVRTAYPKLPPIFATIEAALAEFPLSEPPDRPEVEPPEIDPSVWYSYSLPPTTTYYPVRWVIGFDGPAKPQDARSRQQRALDARRNRNTGPADQRGLDGHRRTR